MRNLKRALSLALASVMLMGMMVVGSSAASFPDVDDEDNIEAIDVLETVEVMIGNEKGDFEPDKDVTRAEMAVVMAKLLNLDYNYYVTTCPFDDVPDWAKGYVGACAANGIVSGRGDGVYDPNSTVTAVEAASMMMRALGYFQNSGDYKGGFEAATVRQASEIGLFSGINGNARDPMNRNQVAQLALNTLEANMVYFTGDMGFEANGIAIGYRSEYSIRKGTDAKYRAISNQGDATQLQGGGAQGQYYINLGEELYDGDLTKDSGANDDFARFATEWRYKGERIGIYADEADLTYTKAVKIGDIYKDLHLNRTIPARDVEVFVDGVRGGTIDGTAQIDRDIKSGDNDNKYGGNGVLTQVYFYTNVDNVDIVRITEVNTYTGTVIRNVDAKDTKNAYVLIAPETASADEYPAGANSNLEFETDVTFDEDTRILYTYSQSANAIIELAVAESTSGTVTKTENANKDQDDRKALTLDETRYECAVKNAGEKIEENMLNNEYTVYLDFYGYMIYIDEVDVGIGNYALLVNTAGSSTFLGNRARLILADGTVKNVPTTKNYNTGDDKIENYTIVTFRENSDGEYTLRAVPEANSFMNAARSSTAKGNTAALVAADYADLNLETNKANFTVDAAAKKYAANGSDSVGAGATTFRTNSASTFVVADKGDDGNASSFTAYTGIKNAPSVKGDDTDGTDYVAAYWYCKNDNMVTVMFVFPGATADVKNASTKLLYVAKESVSNLISDKNGSQYYLYNAIVGDEIVEGVMVDSQVMVDSTAIFGGSVAKFPTTDPVTSEVYNSQSAATKGQMKGIFQSYSADKDGIITDIERYKTFTVGNDEELLTGSGIDKRNKEYTVILNTAGVSQTITVADDADIYYVTDKGVINEWSYSRIAVDENDTIYAVVKEGMVRTLIIEEVKPAAPTYTVSFNGMAALNEKIKETLTSLSATEGGSVTFTLTPKDGITIDNVVADYGDLSRSGSTWTLSNINRNATITVTTSGSVVESNEYDGTLNFNTSIAGQTGTVTVEWTSNKTTPVAPTYDELYNALLEELIKKGYDKDGLEDNSDGTDPSFKATKRNGVSIASGKQVTFTLDVSNDLAQVVEVATQEALTAALAGSADKVKVTANIEYTGAPAKPIEVASSVELTVKGNQTLTQDITGAGKVITDGDITAAQYIKTTGGVVVAANKTLTYGANTTLAGDITGAGKVSVAGYSISNGDKIKATGGLEITNAGGSVDKLSDVPLKVTAAVTSLTTGRVAPSALTFDGSGAITLNSAAAELVVPANATLGAVTVTDGKLTLAGNASVAAGKAINIGTKAIDFGNHTLTGGTGSTVVVGTGATVTNFDASEQNFYDSTPTKLATDNAIANSTYTWTASGSGSMTADGWKGA